MACVQANSDISGIGVRVSFYVQVTCLVGIVVRSPRSNVDSGWTLLATSVGLTISALAGAAQNSLPLEQALVVMDLIWIATYCTMIVLFIQMFSAQRPTAASIILGFFVILHAYFATASMMFLWTHLPSLVSSNVFGNPSNDPSFVVIGATVSALHTGRPLALALLSLALIGLCGILWWVIQVEMDVELPGWIKDNYFLGRETDHLLIFVVLLWFIPTLLVLVSTELQINKSHFCPGNNTWGFGQILAFTVMFAPLISLIRVYSEYGIGIYGSVFHTYEREGDIQRRYDY